MNEVIATGSSAAARIYTKASHAQDAADRLRAAGFNDVRLSEAVGTTTAEHVPPAEGQTKADFTATLERAGFDVEVAREFAQAVARGGVLLTVSTLARTDDALAVLRGETVIGPVLAPVDIPGAPDTVPSAPDAVAVAPDTVSLAPGDTVLPLRAERLEVTKERIMHEARVRRETVTEHRTIVVPVQREELVVERDGEGDIRIPIKERLPEPPR